MKILVQKYGGSSVATPDHLRTVAEKICETRRRGYSVVVVASAMGDTTDELLGMARDLTSSPSHRELDMLLSSGERISISLLTMTLQELGVDAISLTGPQSGVVTTSDHFNATIISVDPTRILEELQRGHVVVAAGYQGRSSKGEYTTLGRGGSDTTAVALAQSLNAQRCEIYSDVNGILTGDPRVVDGPLPLASLEHDEACELARSGAQVLARSAAAYARDHGIVLKIASTTEAHGGTVIRPLKSPEARVAAVATHERLIWFRSANGDTARIHETLSRHDAGEPFLVAPADGVDSDHTLIPKEQIADWHGLEANLQALALEDTRIRTDVGSVSVVGHGVGRRADLRDRVRTSLSHLADSTLGEWRTSDHAWAWLLPSDATAPALRRLHHDLVEKGRELSGGA